jgi:hypothetical protein
MNAQITIASPLTKPYDGPDFNTWTPQNLANFAKDAYLMLQAQQDALEQARLDLRAAMDQNRILLTKEKRHE